MADLKTMPESGISVVAVSPSDGSQVPVASFTGTDTALIDTGYAKDLNLSPLGIRALFSPTYDRWSLPSSDDRVGTNIGVVGWINAKASLKT